MRTKILVIDDDSEILEWFRASQFHLENEFNYFFLDNSSGIPEAVKKIRPDLIIMDVNLNKISGSDAAEIFHITSYYNIPVVYMATTRWFKATPVLPDKQFMSKPLNRKKVEHKIRTVLNAA